MYEDRTSAEVIADSIWDGVRLVSFRATLPTIVQFHLLRHRAFSFSFASMRAIPLRRQIELVKETPFFPQQWPKNQSGMSASENLEGIKEEMAQAAWALAGAGAIHAAEKLGDFGVHKEIAARLLLPFSWSTCIISTTMPGLDNFFAQRDHADAQPEIRTLAKAMRKALDESTPEESAYHVPFGHNYLGPTNHSEDSMIRAVAHCARVSYGREMEEKTYEEDVNLVVRLLKAGHASPFEHVGIVMPETSSPYKQVAAALRRADHLGNFEYPWSQLRHHVKDYLPTIAAKLDSEHST